MKFANWLKNPRTWFQLIGVAIVFGTFTIAAIPAYNAVVESASNMQFSAPGAHEVNFENTGKYTISYGIENDYNPTGISLKDMIITFESTLSGYTIPVSNIYGELAPNLEGKPLFEFEIEESGNYVLETAYPHGTTTQETVLTIEQDSDPFATFLRSFGIAFGGFVLGMGIVLWAMKKQPKSG